MQGVINVDTGKLKAIIIEPPYVATWKSMTRSMIEHYKLGNILSWLDDCIAEVSDELWKEKEWLKDKTFPKRDFDYKQKRKTVIKPNLQKSMIKKQINDNLNIIDVAKSYGIILKGKKALCPFHKDSEPSLVFYDKTNTFKCYGCNSKGDIVEFIKRCENEKL